MLIHNCRPAGRRGWRLAPLGWLSAPAGCIVLVCFVAGCIPVGRSDRSDGNARLEAMKTAYQQAHAYADAAELHIEIVHEGESHQLPARAFDVSLERPNKLAVDSFGGRIRCDGQNFSAEVLDPAMSDQVLLRDAPADLAIKHVYSDSVLNDLLFDNNELRLPQLELLLGDRPLEQIFGKDYVARRLEDRELKHAEVGLCQIVEVTGSLGKFVAWMTPKDHILRRLELPTEPFQNRYSRDRKVEFHKVWVDFDGARFSKAIDPSAFKFEAPQEACFVKQLVLPPAVLREPPPTLLGQKVPQLQFVDLQGNTVALDDLHDKVVVLDMWELSCGWCFRGFPNLQKVQEQFKDNDRVKIYTVNTDAPSFSDKTVQAAFDKAELTLPILRDPKEQAQNVLKVEGLPTTIVIGPDGTVQDYDLGFHADLAEKLPKKIERLLAGENLNQEVLAAYDAARQEFEQQKASQSLGVTKQIPIQRATIGERSDPETFQLKQLWSAAGVEHPGNLLVLEGDAGPRIFVLDGWKKVVELDAGGKVVGEHALELETGTTVTRLRTGVDGQGRRFFAGFSTRDKKVYAFDADWKPLFNYPEDTRYPLADVQFGDLDGDGQLELIVAYLAEVGVQCVSLEGKRIWSNRDFDILLSVAVYEPTGIRQHQLLCANERDVIGVLDHEGKKLADLPVPGHGVDIVVAAELDGQEPPELAGLASPAPGRLVALGIDRSGGATWTYQLPEGAHLTPCELLIPGRLRSEGPRQWLLCGPDGSIHVIDAGGKLLDRFNHGGELTGIATVQLDGQPVLLIAGTEKLSAYAVDWGAADSDHAQPAAQGEAKSPQNAAEPGKSDPTENNPAAKPSDDSPGETEA